MKYKVKKIKAFNGGQYPNPWEFQSGGYQYPGYQPMSSYNYQSPYEPVTQPIAPQGETQVTQPVMNQPQSSGNNMGQKVGSMAAGFGRAAGQALNALMVGGPQLINAMLPEQEVYREDRSLPRTYNPFPQGTGSQAIYKDGGELKAKYKDGGIKKPVSKRPISPNYIGAINQIDSLNYKDGFQEALYNNQYVYDRGTFYSPRYIPLNEFRLQQNANTYLSSDVNEEVKRLVDMESAGIKDFESQKHRINFYDDVVNDFLISAQQEGKKKYKDGGKVAKNGYRTKKRKQGNIQIEEEVPIDALPMIPMSYQPPFVPQQVPLPQIPEAREISFERLADVSGNPATYVPQFQGYNYFEALQALKQLPESIDNIPVTRSPQLYQDLFQNFQPNTQASQWVPYPSDYYPQPLTPFENGGTIEPKFMKGYAESGIHIKPSKRGTFTKAAKERGMGVQEFASRVMANKENYSPAMVKKANFARVFGGRNYKNGGLVEGQEIELDDAEILQLIQQGYEIEF